MKPTLTFQIIVRQILLFLGDTLQNLIRTYTFINFWNFSFKTWFSFTQMRKNPSYAALLRPTCLLISEKSATYTINWSYTIIWQIRVSCFEKLKLNWDSQHGRDLVWVQQRKS